jgi:hypothetical protein
MGWLPPWFSEGVDSNADFQGLAEHEHEHGYRRQPGQLVLQDGVAVEKHVQAEVESQADSKQNGNGVLVDGRIRDGLESCIGRTPLVRIKSLSEATGCEILGKAEFMNGCGGSPKDRVALSVIAKVFLSDV